MTRDSLFKGGVFGGTQTIASLNEIYEHEETYRLLSEKLYGAYCGISFTHESSIRLAAEEVIRELQPSGIVQRAVDRWVQKRFINPPPKEDEPIVFSLSRLAIGFQVYLVCIFISFIAFLIECWPVFKTFIKFKLVCSVINVYFEAVEDSRINH